MRGSRHPGFSVGVPIESRALVVLACSGELDLATEAVLDEAVERCLARSPRTVHIDCTEIDFMDSMGVRALVRAAQRVRKGGGRVSFSFEDRSVRHLRRAGIGEPLLRLAG